MIGLGKVYVVTVCNTDGENVAAHLTHFSVGETLICSPTAHTKTTTDQLKIQHFIYVSKSIYNYRDTLLNAVSCKTEKTTSVTGVKTLRLKVKC